MILTLSIAILVVISSTTADPLYQHLDQHSQAIIRAIRTSSSLSSEVQANSDLYGSNGSSPCQTRAQLITPKNGDQLLTTSTTEYRRQFVVNMTREAWNGYARHAWGQHYLLPLSTGQLEGWKAYSGQTLVGALSTLWLMDLKEEFALGRRWVEKEMIVDDRCLPKLGALLSAYALTGDGLFKAKAKEIADLYTPADLSLEKGDVPLQQKLVLEEWMQQRLEYPYLSNITGDPRYLKRVRRMDRFFGSADQISGQNKVLDEPDKSNWSVKVKAYIQSKGKDTADLEQYYDLIEALEAGGHLRPSRSGLVYIRDDQSLPISNLMSSRYCHFGATLALGQLHRLTTPIGIAWQKYSTELQQTVRHLDLAKKVVELCHLAATSTETGLPPLKFFVDERRGGGGVLTGAQQSLNLESSNHASPPPEVFCWSESGLSESSSSCQRSASSSSRSFDLGPQLAESYFVLWRLTGDPRYREYAWSLTKAIYKHARTVNGYAQVRDVLSMPAAKEDYQPPNFLSATLKYLYLIFADDNTQLPLPLSLDSWVFTGDGQPLPVCESSVCFEGSPGSPLSDTN